MILKIQLNLDFCILSVSSKSMQKSRVFIKKKIQNIIKKYAKNEEYAKIEVQLYYSTL